MYRLIGVLLPLSLLLGACGAAPEAPGEGIASREECEVAFDEIETGTTIERLETNLRALDATIERCPSVDVWVEVAQEKLPDVDLSDAEAFISARCQENTALSGTVLCESQ